MNQQKKEAKGKKTDDLRFEELPFLVRTLSHGLCIIPEFIKYSFSHLL